MSMVYNMKVMVTSSAMMGENKTRKILAFSYEIHGSGFDG